MRLTDVVAAAVTDQRAPAAALALVYAEQIDQATHVTSALAAALDTLRAAADLADEATELGDDAHAKAYRKVAAALGAVTVAGDLGPKLLGALDAMLLTPRARANAGQAVANAAAASPLSTLRSRHDGRGLRAV